ncbi:glutathione S-transferase family protein [Acinetobacter larvae]|uniref:Glutathione S-transferase n=1 Tax=Acinetobacter larvae TaxID=1789224 RepID=A0A1B2LYC5_9GAMM|nr:glutathione S-transferase [Acinetobacter larvae]AOA57944.1 glutathione S-transferase [Acinetobacter larvae]
MRILYQFPLSHFCEKARWLLDFKQLEYVAHNLVPGVHRAFAQLKTRQNSLPILKDQQQWIADSSMIALYLDEKYPEHSFLRAQQDLRDQALETNQLANELGVHVRRWSLSQALAMNDSALEVMIGESGYLRQFEKYSKPILKTMMSRSYQLSPQDAAASKAQMQSIIEQLNQQLVENHGRYLVSERLGLADIAVCSMLAPILEIETTPWERDSQVQQSDEFNEYKQQLLALPLGQYVQRIYMTERRARVDWRGV